MPTFWEETVPPDSELQAVGDAAFIGLDNRQQPEQLPEGYVQVSQNMRLNQLQATVRKGMEKQTNDISFANSPLTLPFVLSSTATLNPSFTDGIFASQIYADTTTNKEWIVVATGTKSYMFSPGETVTIQQYPTNEEITSADKVDMFQAGGSMYMLRGLALPSAAVSTLTSSSSTATLTTTIAHGLSTNMYIKVAGADQTEYNGVHQVTVTGASTVTYSITGAPASPATGTITYQHLKIPLRWVPSTEAQLARGASVEHHALATAVWLRHGLAVDEAGQPYTLNDPLADWLRANAADQREHPERSLHGLLSRTDLWGQTLSANAHWRSRVAHWHRLVLDVGVDRAIEALLSTEP